MTKRFDAIVIGTGQAGPSLANRLDQEGLKTAIIERKLVGGTCVNVGCIPTKTLVGSAKVAYAVRQARQFGVIVDGPVDVDMGLVKERKDAISGGSNKGLTEWLEGMENVTLIRGHARFSGPHTVQVGEDSMEADKIFVDVGARARVPDIEGLKDN